MLHSYYDTILLVTKTNKKKIVGTYTEHNMWYVTQNVTYYFFYSIYLFDNKLQSMTKSLSSPIKFNKRK